MGFEMMNDKMNFNITEADNGAASTFIYAKITAHDPAALEQGKQDYLKSYPALAYMTSFTKAIIKNGSWYCLAHRLSSCE